MLRELILSVLTIKKKWHLRDVMKVLSANTMVTIILQYIRESNHLVHLNVFNVICQYISIKLGKKPKRGKTEGDLEQCDLR